MRRVSKRIDTNSDLINTITNNMNRRESISRKQSIEDLLKK